MLPGFLNNPVGILDHDHRAGDRATVNDRRDAGVPGDHMKAVNVDEIGPLHVRLLRFRGKINAKRPPSLRPQFRQDRGADQAGRASDKRHAPIRQCAYPF